VLKEVYEKSVKLKKEKKMQLTILVCAHPITVKEHIRGLEKIKGI